MKILEVLTLTMAMMLAARSESLFQSGDYWGDALATVLSVLAAVLYLELRDKRKESRK